MNREGQSGSSSLSENLGAGVTTEPAKIAGRQYRTILAQKTMSNYFNHIAATPLDDKFSAMAWEPNSQYKHSAFIPVPMLQSGNDSIFRIHLTTTELHP
jgi:hypothetical protein